MCRMCVVAAMVWHLQGLMRPRMVLRSVPLVMSGIIHLDLPVCRTSVAASWVREQWEWNAHHMVLRGVLLGHVLKVIEKVLVMARAIHEDACVRVV